MAKFSSAALAVPKNICVGIALKGQQQEKEAKQQLDLTMDLLQA